MSRITVMTIQSSAAPRLQQDLVARNLGDYGVARFRDQVFDAVHALWARRRAEGWTQKEVADAIGRDTGWVSRNLSAPGNWTLRIVGELVQGLGGEGQISILPKEDPVGLKPNCDAYEGYRPSDNTPPEVSQSQMIAGFGMPIQTPIVQAQTLSVPLVSLKPFYDGARV
jgi:hypothetical protein